MLLIFPTKVAAQELPSRLLGLWALAHTNRDYCKEYADGKLTALSRAEASNFGLVHINQKDMRWVYTLAGCVILRVDGGPIRYLAKANCHFKSTEYTNDIVFALSPSRQMTMSFSACGPYPTAGPKGSLDRVAQIADRKYCRPHA
jgi:hypothetical protein